MNNEYSVEKDRINRINHLLARLDTIPKELDEVHEKLFNPGGFTRDEYAHLVDKRTALLYEQERVERELKEAYQMKLTK